GLFGNAMLAAQFPDLFAALLGFFQNADDLLFAEPVLLHARIPFRSEGILTFSLDQFLGSRSQARMNGPHHINTDLELESLEDLTPIVAAFGSDVVVLFHGEAMGHRRASFEVSGLVADPDALLNHFCMLAEALAAPERAVWDRCS